MPLRSPPPDLFDLDDERPLPPGMGMLIAFGIGALSWGIVVAVAVVLLHS